jgi:hypothetical protein
VQLLAEQGGGEAYFTADANQLPRVFAQDVMHLARKKFVEQATAVAPGRGALALQLPLAAIPNVGGYKPDLSRAPGPAGPGRRGRQLRRTASPKSAPAAVIEAS